MEVKKVDVKKGRSEKAARLKTMLEENAELFEVPFLTNSGEQTGCVEWLDDVAEALCRYILVCKILCKFMCKFVVDFCANLCVNFCAHLCVNFCANLCVKFCANFV